MTHKKIRHKDFVRLITPIIKPDLITIKSIFTNSDQNCRVISQVKIEATFLKSKIHTPFRTLVASMRYENKLFICICTRKYGQSVVSLLAGKRAEWRPVLMK